MYIYIYIYLYIYIYMPCSLQCMTLLLLPEALMRLFPLGVGGESAAAEFQKAQAAQSDKVYPP